MNNWIPTGGRGSGRTTRCMLDAPKGSIFVWGQEDLRYPKEMAMVLGRTDLKIVGPSWLNEPRYQGLDPIHIRADHWVNLTERQWQTWMHAKMYERIRNPPKTP